MRTCDARIHAWLRDMSLPHLFCLRFLQVEGEPDGRMTEWQNDGVAEWQNGRMTEWQNDGVAEWQSGRMKVGVVPIPGAGSGHRGRQNSGGRPKSGPHILPPGLANHDSFRAQVAGRGPWESKQSNTAAEHPRNTVCPGCVSR